MNLVKSHLNLDLNFSRLSGVLWTEAIGVGSTVAFFYGSDLSLSDSKSVSSRFSFSL